jgi:type IV secretory pathway VirB4 component
MALNARSAQEFVPIKEIRNGVIILKDGGLRSVLIASSINLSLKSSEEQVAIINQFQSFLNSLDFSTQIVMQSRRLDIRPYLLMLEERQREQTEKLLKIQTREYIEFIRSFTEEVNIMTKTFFVVVPYSSTIIKSGGMVDKLFGGGPKKQVADNKKAEDMASFEEKRSQLDQRIGVIVQGLAGLGIRSSPLNTEELVELFYKTFNPGDISQGIKLQ